MRQPDQRVRRRGRSQSCACGQSDDFASWHWMRSRCPATPSREIFKRLTVFSPKAAPCLYFKFVPRGFGRAKMQQSVPISLSMVTQSCCKLGLEVESVYSGRRQCHRWRRRMRMLVVMRMLMLMVVVVMVVEASRMPLERRWVRHVVIRLDHPGEGYVNKHTRCPKSVLDASLRCRRADGWLQKTNGCISDDAPARRQTSLGATAEWPQALVANQCEFTVSCARPTS